MAPVLLHPDRSAAWRVLLLVLSLTAWACPLDAARRSAGSGPPTRTITVDGYPISIEFLPGDEKVAEKIASLCVEVMPRLSRELGLAKTGPFRVFLIADMASFQRARDIRLPAWGVAFAFMDHQIMLVDVKRATSAWNSLDRVIPHELSHLLVAQRAGDVRMPIWFVEGLAMWQAREWSLLENWRLMEAVWGNRAPGLGQIHSALPASESRARDAYRVAYTGLMERFDDEMERVPVFLDEMVRAGDFSTAFETFWNEGEREYYARFGEALARKYRSRLLLFQTGPLFTVVAVLFLFVFLRIRLRNRKKLKRLERIDRGLSLDD